LSSKSTFSSSTSKSYALALYELAKENSELDKVENEIRGLGQLLEESSDFNELISNPTVSKENKKNIIFEIAKKNSFSSILKKFLGFVALKNRLFFLDKIVQSFLNLVSNNKDELDAKFVSSKKLSLDQKKEIQNQLSIDFKSKLNINFEYDPGLIAGSIIQIGSIMIDTSIKTKLKKLERNMIEA